MAQAVPFAYVAESVAQRAAELLAATIAVTDEDGLVITQASPKGSPVRETNRLDWSSGLRIPIHLQGWAGYVVAMDSQEAVSPRLAQALIELVVTQAAVVAQFPTQDDLRGKLVRDLLAGHVTDEVGLLREAQVLGMDLSRPRAVFLIHAADYILSTSSARERGDDTTVCRRARDVIGQVVRFFNLPNAAICTYLGDGEVAILKASSTRDLAPWTLGTPAAETPVASWANLSAQKRAGQALLAWLERQTGTSVAIGIGRYHPGITGLARSYQDARAALSLGRRLRDSAKVHCLDDLGAAAFVGISDERTKQELAVRLLGPLDQEPDLFATLQVFFEENCCPSKTAARLAIHRNTLGYRLDKIASLTGLDPRRFDDAIQIRLALLLQVVRTEPIAQPAA